MDVPDPASPLDVSAIVAMRGYTHRCLRRVFPALGAYADTTWSQGLAQTQDDDPGCGGWNFWRCADDALEEVGHPDEDKDLL